MLNKTLLALVLLSACGNNNHPCATDALQRDYYWAWAQYADSWCSWYERCNPDSFKMYYHDHDTCTSDNASFCDAYLGYTLCRMSYPDDKTSTLMQCVQDQKAQDCNAFFGPESCGTAFTQ